MDPTTPSAKTVSRSVAPAGAAAAELLAANPHLPNLIKATGVTAPAAPALIEETGLEPHVAVQRMRDFLRRGGEIRTLNIAGPRASEQPAIGAFVYRCVAAALRSSPA